MPSNWRVAVGGRDVDRARGRKQAQNLARWWIRQRKGHDISVYHIVTRERWAWRDTTWIRTVEANETNGYRGAAS
ncbi:MAG: hypothetical protein OEL78_04400 [Hyphomicrobiales bacterium]|nr:hypothetical protein [Hyphomicrobiales bacterium]